jgi:fatty acid desaturase
MKIPMWILIIALVVWIIPYVNVILPAFTLIFVVAFVFEEDSVKLVPKGNTIIGKIVKFLTKEV